ncbi:MAG: hypothetical protein RLZZ200_2064 [Pseudomonadota bacterium]|jgi:hypothetical protein
MRRLLPLMMGLGAPLAIAAAPSDPEIRNFVACPIVRDTTTVPCWLSEHEGELYFLTLQADVSAPVNPPWLGHKVLVEGRIKPDAARICGGVVLEPVHLSIIAEPDATCTMMLPAEERYNLTFEPPRPPGPSAGRLAFNTLPMPVKPVDVKREVKQYSLSYDFDGLINFKHPFQLTPILDMAHAMQVSRVEITGHRGSALLSNGTVLPEQADRAKRRAEQVAELLRGAGLTAPKYDVRWRDAAPPPDGSDDHRQRRVDITLRP